MHPARSRAAAALVSVLVALGLAACGGSSRQGAPPPKPTTPTTILDSTPSAAVSGFVRAWQAQAWTTMIGYVQTPPSGFVSELASTYEHLGATALTVTARAPTVSGTTGSAPVTQQMTISGHGPLTLHTTIDLVEAQGQWLVSWTWSSLQSQLGAGYRLSLARTWGPRAAIEGAGARPLAASQALVQVGLAGERIKQPALVDRLLVAGGATAAQATAALQTAKAHPTQFVPVFDITEAAYRSTVRPSRLYSVAGTQFQPTTKLVPATPGLGSYLIGGLGPVTAQQLRTLGPAYGAGDVVGQGGIEGQYERQLAGTPGASLEVVDATGGLVSIVHRWAPVAGTPVRTTISVAAQQAAEAAIASTATPSALVAVQASTGKLLAVATHDPTNSGVDYALDATEAPGSTFKVVTSTALIVDHHATLTTPATCPATRTVDGETFHNDAGEALGSIDLLTAFAKSCNTAYIGLATSDLNPAQLAAAAHTYDLGTAPQIGYPAFGGSVPVPADRAELAATSIGQGRTTVSPLALAMVAAAADTGTVRSPRLVAGAPGDTAPTHRLGPKVVADLHTMMSAVVTSGTAAGSGLPAGTSGKTGTAEFGTSNPPQTHAWFIGFRGDIAFAVFVDVGVAGAAIAAPLAAHFLDAVSSLKLR